MRILHKLILGLTATGLALATPNCTSADEPGPDLEQTVQEIEIRGTVIDVQDLPFAILQENLNYECNVSYTSLTKVSIRKIMSNRGTLRLLYILPSQEEEPTVPYKNHRVHLVYRTGQEISTDEILRIAGVRGEVLNLAVHNRVFRSNTGLINFYIPLELRLNPAAPSKETAQMYCEQAFVEAIQHYDVDGIITDIINSERREYQLMDPYTTL
ncbi:MAG: hypothetical protein ABIG93_00625 [archaeon]|nr:hypothetical protein [Nanoarchaeota archaeon]